MLLWPSMTSVPSAASSALGGKGGEYEYEKSALKEAKKVCKKIIIKTNMDKKTMTKVILSGVVGLGLVLLLVLNPFVVVSAGQRGVVSNFGAISNNILQEGLHWRTPILQSVIKIDVRTQKEEVGAEAASKDLQTVHATIALNYHLDPTKVNLLWQKVGRDVQTTIIAPAIQEAVKASVAKYTAEELITKRAMVKEDAKGLLITRLGSEAIIVDELSIVNFDFSASFNAAIEAKVTAEQNALAAKNKLEQVKFEAEQRVAQAQAEAEAIRIQAESISKQGGESYVQMKAIERWDGKLPQQFVPGSALPFINLK